MCVCVWGGGGGVKLDISGELAASRPFTKKGSPVVECLTRGRAAAGLSLTGITALWFLGKTHLS